MQRLLRLVVLVSLGVSLGAPARAEPVTFEFLGVVDSVQDWGNWLHGAVVPGFVFTGSYTFESTAANVSLSEDEGLYMVPPQQEYGFQVMVQTLIGFAPIVVWEDVVHIKVFDRAGDLNDSYELWTPDPQVSVLLPPGGSALASIGLRGPGALSGLDLPLVPPDLGLFPVMHELRISAFASDGFGLFGIRGPILQLTLPEPASPGVAALAALGWMQVRRWSRARRLTARSPA
jgi:hypothetical protein